MEPAAPTWLTTRSAGVLAHISSLPGRYGIGNLGAGTRSLVDFLGRAGVRYWQICPVGPTGFGDSPYQTFSGRAGNPYFIDLDELALAGLLTDEDLAPLRRLPAESVDYGGLYEDFWRVLALAYDRFAASHRDEIGGLGSLAAFRRAQAAWLEPFAAFMALKSHFGGQPWTQWPEAFRTWSAGLHAVLPAARAARGREAGVLPVPVLRPVGAPSPLRGRAQRRHHRRRADLRRPRQRRHLAEPRGVPPGRAGQPAGRRRRSAGLFLRGGGKAYELAEQRTAELDAVIESMPHGVYIATPDAKIRSNHVAKMMSGGQFPHELEDARRARLLENGLPRLCGLQIDGFEALPLRFY